MQPEDIVNRALDVLPGVRRTVGSLQSDGTTESEAARRIYGRELRALLRAAHWDWARKRTTLYLLADATGQTPNVSTYVEYPWIYAYAWPNDCVRARWLPWTGTPPGALAGFGAPPQNIQPVPGNVPISSGLNVVSPGLAVFEAPARFLVSSTDQYPSQAGNPPWDQLADYEGLEGTGPVNRRIILTNVPPQIQPLGAQTLPGPQLVYTYLALELELWDALFENAMVHVLASYLAPVVMPDPKLALAERNAHVQIAQRAVRDARVASAQEAGWKQTTDHTADWHAARRSGWARWGNQPWGGGGGPGYYGMGYEAMTWSDGSVF